MKVAPITRLSKAAYKKFNALWKSCADDKDLKLVIRTDAPDIAYVGIGHFEDRMLLTFVSADKEQIASFRINPVAAMNLSHEILIHGAKAGWYSKGGDAMAVH